MSGSGQPRVGLRVGLSMASAIILSSNAVASEAVLVRTGHHPGFARLVFEWARAAGVVRDRRAGTIVLRFDRPMAADLDRARADLAQYVEGISTQDGAREIWLRPLTGVDAQVWTSDDRKVVVDLRSRRSDGEARIAVRVGAHEGYERIVLQWQAPVSFAVTQMHPKLRIEFDQPSTAELEILRQQLPTRALSADVGVDGNRGWLELELTSGTVAEVSNQGHADRVVIDLTATPTPLPSVKADVLADSASRLPPIPRPKPVTLTGGGREFVAASAVSARRPSATSHPSHPAWSWLTWVLQRVWSVLWDIIGWQGEPAIVQSSIAPRRGPLGDPREASASRQLLAGGALGGGEPAPPYQRDTLASRAAPIGLGRPLLEHFPPGSPRHALAEFDDRPGRFPRVASDEPADRARELEAGALDAVVAGAMQTEPDVPVPLPGGATSPDRSTSDDPEDNPELEALNRVLVEAGGLLLPPWGVELAPSSMYEYQGSTGLLIVEQEDGRRTAVAQQARRDTVEAATTLRLGLPWDSQVEVRVPYVYSDEELSIGGQQQDSRNTSGLGDVELGVSHQFLHAGTWYPDLLGEVRWKTNTGKDSFDAGSDGLATGSGFHGIGGSLTAVQSYDPMVFFGRLAYTANLEDEKDGFKIDPGDTLSLGLGAILSAGPGTSFRFGLSQSFTDEVEVDGEKIAGTDEVSGVLQIGASAALPNRALLDISAGVGITDDAPDFVIRASLPYRF